MPETVHLVAGRRQEEGTGTEILYSRAGPSFLVLGLTSYNILPLYMTLPRDYFLSQASSQAPSSFSDLTSCQTTPLMQEMIWGSARPNWNDEGPRRWMRGYMDLPL